MNLIDALTVFGLKSLEGQTQKSLKRKYRVLAKERHPDRTGGGSSEFIELREAYVVLKKEVKIVGDDDPAPEVSSPSNSEQRASEKAKSSGSKGKSVIDPEHKKKEEAKKPAVVSDSKELKALSKDELLEKYYSDTKDLESKIGSLMNNHELHRNVLDVVESEVTKLSEEYRSEISTLQIQHQKQINRLEKNAVYRFWIKYFVSPLTGKDIWNSYRENVDKYESSRKTLQTNYNTKLLEIYGESLNEMSKYLTSEEHS